MSSSKSGWRSRSATSMVSTSRGLVARASARPFIGALTPVMQRERVARRGGNAPQRRARLRSRHVVDRVVVTALFEEREIADRRSQPKAAPLTQSVMRALATESVVELGDQRVAEAHVVHLELAAAFGQRERHQRADLAGWID